MLVLSRRTNDSIHIGNEIVVTVLGVEGDKVKIGISAPRELTILRGEIYAAIESQEKIKAFLQSSPEPDSFKELRALLENEVTEKEITQSPSSEGMPVRRE